MVKIAYKRGDIVKVNLGNVLGSEQGGVRYVIIVQNDLGNKFAPTIIVLPITTSEVKHKLPTHQEIKLTSVYGLILGEQIRTIDRQRILKCGQVVDHISDMRLVDKALAISVGLTLAVG